MPLLELKGINKVYETANGKKKYALDNINLTLPNSGLVALVGKSGSGKSTLLNILSTLDKPSSGKVLFNEEDIKKWNERKLIKYRNSYIGMIFQHYQLLEEHSVLYNIMLPALIKGDSESDAKEDAITLLKGIDFPTKLYYSKCSNLSGGEKQRVAILRSLINNPKIILADEPTGALDASNGKRVMEILKNASRTRLVIVVSHNNELVNKYADRIITISDGRIISNKINIEENNGVPIIKEPFKAKKTSWMNKITNNNLKKRSRRNILSILSMIVGISSSVLISGFSNGSPVAIAKESLKQLDYSSLVLDKEIVTPIGGSGVSLVKTIRPTPYEMNSLSTLLTNYDIYFNYDALFPINMDISYKDKKIKDIYYQPIHSYELDSINKSLLYKGNFPTSDNLKEVVINDACYDSISKTIAKDPLNELLKIEYQYQYIYNDLDNDMTIVDYYVYEETIRITGVVKEMSFLATPKIYYPYTVLDEYLSNMPMNNLSKHMDREISWYDLFTLASDNDSITSYSYRVFAKDINNINKDIESIPSPFLLSSNGVDVSNALKDLFNAATMGMEVFLLIAIIGTILILGIVSFSSYVEDKKISAILSCLGASKDEIIEIYLKESLIIGLIGLAISTIIVYPLQLLINLIVDSTIGINNIIAIPFSRFMGIPFLLPLLMLLLTIIVSLFATYFPIVFSKQISPKEELKDE